MRALNVTSILLLGCFGILLLQGCGDRVTDTEFKTDHGVTGGISFEQPGEPEWEWIVFDSETGIIDDQLFLYVYDSEADPVLAVKIRDSGMIACLESMACGALNDEYDMPKLVDPEIIEAVLLYLFPNGDRQVIMTWSMIKWCHLHPGDERCIPKPKDEG
ncbi:MAG: hypothetical protein KJ970_05580 [Candidatus Eisenbacteria bacterium]|uniref:Lipoprotein n=1 Tax=Eiseniibacteriota bacterium TaxID=2212470 RepID=A0A948RY48_UNCEI|nr:hypothetical protein [Candidatus Eisenbacteria bacterium]MBU2690379.1 hypothetical protein [Candidatus Eisenbacteria bacterium]